MKTLKAFFLSFVLVVFSSVSFAQTKSDTVNVSGNCGMCKKKIETAAKAAGASFASWSPDSKQLVINYNPAATNSVKVQQAVAVAGYDTEAVKASDAAYSKLHECCQYDRTASAKANCCTDGTCAKDAKCCQDGQCAKDASCCTKTDGTACCEPGADCCKDGKCSKHAAKKA